MELKEIIGLNIRRYRNFRDIKQAHLAEQLKRSTRWLGQVENGESDISISDLQKISIALGLPIADFFIGAPNRVFNNYHQQGTYIAAQHNVTDEKVAALYEKIIANLEERIKILEKK